MQRHSADLVKRFTPELYQRMKTALELGKWPNNEKLTREQKENCLEMVLMYEHQHNITEKERTGFLEGKSACK